MDNFDDVEQKIGGDLEVETNENIEKMSVSGLDDEIEAQKKARKLNDDEKTEKLSEINDKAQEENKDNVKNFAKSQKSKKSLKKRIIAWALGVGIFAGAVAGITPAVKKSVDYNTTGDGAYQKAIKSRYEKVDETLTRRLDMDCSDIIDREVKTIKFEEPGFEDIVLEIDVNGKDHVNGGKHQRSLIYNVLIDYYNALVDAEESNNMLDYLDCLNEVFENMKFKDEKTDVNFDFDLSSIGENAGEKLSELFALDFEKEGIVKQIGFLPYNFEITDWQIDFEAHEYVYSCKLSGISYCETSFESPGTMPDDENLISNGNVSSKNIKTYNREIEISSRTNKMLFVSNENQGGKAEFIMGDFADYVNGTKTNFEVKTTYFEEVNIYNSSYNVLEEYDNMRNGNFDYEKPEDVDMSLYK